MNLKAACAAFFGCAVNLFIYIELSSLQSKVNRYNAHLAMRHRFYTGVFLSLNSLFQDRQKQLIKKLAK